LILFDPRNEITVRNLLNFLLQRREEKIHRVTCTRAGNTEIFIMVEAES
jgi:hypothetical protein